MRELSWGHTLASMHTCVHLPIHPLQQQDTQISYNAATLLEASVTPTWNPRQHKALEVSICSFTQEYNSPFTALSVLDLNLQPWSSE